MMRTSLLACLFISAAFVLQAQRITMYKTFGSVIFEKDSTIISSQQVKSLLQENPEALQLFKKARKNSTISSALGFTGGLLVLIPVGSAILGREPDWKLAIGGAACFAASIPFNRIFKRQAYDALEIYNSKHASLPRPTSAFFWTGNTVGIQIKF